MDTKQLTEYAAVFSNLLSESPVSIAGGQGTFETLRKEVEAEAIQQVEALAAMGAPIESLANVLATFERMGRIRVLCGLFHVASINARVPAEPPTSMLQ